MSLLLFDLDGTLYSSRGILPDAYRLGINQFNEEFDPDVDVPSDEAIFDQVGKPAPEIYRNLFPDLDDRETSALQDRIFSALLERIKRKDGELYDGVREVLDRLADSFDLGLVTNAQTAYMEAALKAHDLDQYFGKTLCHDDAPEGRKSELVAEMLEFFDGRPETTRMIGDRQSDYEAANKHDVPFIHCTYGYGSDDSFPGSQRIKAFGELLDEKVLPDPDNAGTEANRC